jgi:hypothetical protein
VDLWTMRCRAPGRLPWKSLATFPPHVPSPTSSTELYSVRIKSQKVKTNRITGQPTATGRAPLIKERFLSKQTGPPLRQRSRTLPNLTQEASTDCADWLEVAESIVIRKRFRVMLCLR